MKEIHFRYFIFILILYASNSCNLENNSNKTNEVASINDQKIYIQEVDLALEREIYGVLYQLYEIRGFKIDEIISKRIIHSESEKYKISSDSLLNLNIYLRINITKLKAFALNHHYDTCDLPTLVNSISDNKTASQNSQNELLEKYKAFQLRTYLDSLKKLYNVTILLQPPSIPIDKLKKIEAQYKGNLNSQVTVWLLSDLECITCREAKPIYDKIFQKYKSKIKFAFSYYSDRVTISSLALKCASNQNKFWEFYNSLYSSKKTPDFESVTNLANDLGLDVNKFISEIQDSLTYYKIYDNFNRINNAGFYKTPSIVVNYKEISNPTSIEEIENVIEYELSQQN
jgi:protein-disulfide isomerase